MDLRLKAPSCLQICGISQSGKSYLTAQIIRERQRLFTEEFQTIIWIFREYQPLYDKLKLEFSNIIFSKDLKEAEPYLQSTDHVLLVLDDCLMDLIHSSSKFLPYFIQGSHHQNNTIVLLTQTIFVPNNRIVQLNCHYIILLTMARDSSSVLRLAYQISPLRPKFVYLAYKDAINREPYGHLLIDSFPHQQEIARYRSSVFFWKDNFVLYSPKS